MATTKKQIAKALPKRDSQKNTTPRVMDSEELLFYNGVLDRFGKEAADQWLNDRWQTT